MFTMVHFVQIVIAISIIFVWVFRWENIVKEFKHFNLSKSIRNTVGIIKVALSILLITSIWYPKNLSLIALSIALLMLCAQYNHWKVKNPPLKYIPSFSLFILSIFVVSSSI